MQKTHDKTKANKGTAGMETAGQANYTINPICP